MTLPSRYDELDLLIITLHCIKYTINGFNFVIAAVQAHGAADLFLCLVCYFYRAFYDDSELEMRGKA